MKVTDPVKICYPPVSTQKDILYAAGSDGKRAGSVRLIWGNGEDLIADCSESVEPLVDRII